MIETYNILSPDFERDAPREMTLLSIISQSFFQPFSLEDNLLVILTALTSGSGVGFNRAMLFLKHGDRLKGEMWLGPSSAEEAGSIWEVLSTPGIGYIEIIEHNRALVNKNEDTLSARLKGLVYSADEGGWYIHDTVSDTTCRGLYPTRGDALAAWNRAHWRVRDMIPEAAARRRDP